MSTYDAVLLDMDGTIVNSDAAVERAWRTWATEHEITWSRLEPYLHGSPTDRTIGLLLPNLDEAEAARSAERQLNLQVDDLADVVAAVGWPELHSALLTTGTPWIVVTSAPARLAKARLGAAGIEPDLLVTRDDVVHGKPDPEGFLIGARLLGVDAARCLAVEDSPPGIDAARASGAAVAALRGLDGDFRVGDLRDVARLLG